MVMAFHQDLGRAEGDVSLSDAFTALAIGNGNLSDHLLNPDNELLLRLRLEAIQKLSKAVVAEQDA